MKYDKIKKYYALKAETAQIMDREPTEDEMDDIVAMNKDFGSGFKARDFESFEVDNDDERELELRFKIGVSNMNLVKARLEKGLDQKDVGALIGISCGSYSQIETCRAYPPIERQDEIAKVLGKTRQYLFPDWLNVFTTRWKQTEKERTLKLKAESLDSPEVAGLLADPSSLQENAENELLRARLKPILENLNPRERKVLEMRYGLDGNGGRTYEETGKEFDMTRERIRQIEAYAFEKIQYSQNAQDLRQFLSD